MLTGFLKVYFFTLLPFIALDGIWLGLFMPKFYRVHIGFILAERPNWIAAAFFYLIFILGMVIFVTGRGGGFFQAVLRGALFGLVCYATYDLTNHATVRDWPLIVTVVDMCWGAFIGGATAAIAVWLKGIF